MSILIMLYMQMPFLNSVYSLLLFYAYDSLGRMHKKGVNT